MEREPKDGIGVERVGELLKFARAELGEASAALLEDPAVQVLALARMRNGYDLEDAVLSQVHESMGVHKTMGRSTRLADEFLGYFLRDLMRLGQRVKLSSLKRFLDTGDLVQSVLGDLWGELARVRFETRGRYLAYLSRKLKWKASNKTRALEADKRSEHRRVDVEGEQDHLQEEPGSPLTQAAQAEDLERLALGLMKLSVRDRSLLTSHLQGIALEGIAKQHNLSYDAARMALKRAIRHARRVV